MRTEENTSETLSRVVWFTQVLGNNDPLHGYTTLKHGNRSLTLCVWVMDYLREIR